MEPPNPGGGEQAVPWSELLLELLLRQSAHHIAAIMYLLLITECAPIRAEARALGENPRKLAELPSFFPMPKVYPWFRPLPHGVVVNRTNRAMSCAMLVGDV